MVNKLIYLTTVSTYGLFYFSELHEDDCSSRNNFLREIADFRKRIRQTSFYPPKHTCI